MHDPWYKQFWPWFFIVVPFVTLIMGGLMLYLAINTQDTLVVDDYYKEGRAINASIAREQEAKVRNISTSLQIEKGVVLVTFLSGMPAQGTAIRLSLYHTTLASRDISVLLSRDANGVYRGFIKQDITGKWRVTIEPVDLVWKLQTVVFLPSKQPVTINP
ncbi:FixH family protein [Salinimonas marina]|uniref:FixH family protein n=1 Tax=Salinimonas marina TaxID=2785918 RepID=A0A7S9E0E9_9ALTE|nr:FixH family protein [Salinimonas marina]QPG07023.1 FixH family protein [Salinimonas marina]